MDSEHDRALDIDIGKKLQWMRKANGMSQKELGERLGVTFQQVQKYERAMNRISPARLYKCARIFGVPIEWFFPDDSFPIDMSIPEAIDTLITRFCHIKSHERRQEVLNIVKVYGDTAWRRRGL